MNDWNAGYVTDIGYTFGCYPELNPVRTELAFIYANLVPGSTATACELGFGQGVNVNVHAAASRVTWFGTDFNPSQAAHARDMAKASGANAHLGDESFEEFCARADLPDFDFIALHGIWSWISEANRAIIVDFVRRKLKPGGILYISYNTQTGWAQMVPMRELLTDHAAVLGSPGEGIVQRVDGAMAFAAKLMAADPKFATANPHAAQRLKEMQAKDRAYLAHEYFNRDWSPMSFASMARTLGEAKLTFACSANYVDQAPNLNMTPAQLAVLAEIADPVFRETVRDFCTNNRFRRDYWVKGSRQLGELKQTEAMMAHRVQLLQPRALVRLKVATELGEADLNPNVHVPILDLLADYRPRSIAEIHTAIRAAEVPLPVLFQSVLLLCGAGILGSVQDDATIAHARPSCDALNRHICEQARSSANLPVLASPVTGGGIYIRRFHQLFLLARSRGVTNENDLVQYAWSQLLSAKQRINVDDKLLSDEENLDYLKNEARSFVENWLPVLIALQLTAAQV